LKGSSLPFDKGRTMMTRFHRRRATTIVWLLLISGAGGAFYSHSTASEQPGSSARRTAAGQRAEQRRSPLRPATGESLQPVERQVVERAVVENDAPRQSQPSVSQAAARDQFNRTVFGSKPKAVPSRAAPPDAFIPMASKPAPPASADLPAILPAEPQELAPHETALQPTPMPPAELPLPTPRRVSEPVSRTPPEYISQSTPADDQSPSDDKKPSKFDPPDLSRIGNVSASIAPPGGGKMPRNYAMLVEPHGEQNLAPPGEPARTSAPFYSTPRVADFTHRPLYFEEKALERNGRNIGLAQPLVSFVHFFGAVPALPYKMGEKPPSRPMYTGNGVNLPSDHVSIRDRVRGTMTAAGTAVGLNAILP